MGTRQEASKIVVQGTGESTCLYVGKNVINLFEKPSTNCEVVSQVLLGAPLAVEGEDGNFVYVKGEDRYSGFADKRHLQAHYDLKNAHFLVKDLFANVYARPDGSSELITRLVLSTRVSRSEAGEFARLLLPGNREGFVQANQIEPYCPLLSPRAFEEAEEKTRISLIESLGRKVVANALPFIGTPYLWGGGTPFGIDCSGLTQVAYKLCGLTLLRDADLQFNDKRFREIEPGAAFDQARFCAGDLLFFGQNITHVGLALGDGRFLHASGRQANFGTYIDSCSEPHWKAIYQGARRLSASAKLSVEYA